MNTPVSFDIAKLLKEKGFYTLNVVNHVYTSLNPDLPEINNEQLLYDEDGWQITDIENYLNHFKVTYWKNACNIIKYNHPIYFAPTIAEVVMWLYERHGLWIWVELSGNIFIPGIRYDTTYRLRVMSKPKEAYEEAIKHTLKEII